MTDPTPTSASQVRRPMISEEEVGDLAARYGEPVRHAHVLHADERLRIHRWRSDSDRRAEVVFAIQNPANLVWLHAKAHYPSHIFRLMSGGVQWHERIEDALFREIDEETSLTCEVERFLGLLTYQFYHDGKIVNFASYVFVLRTDFSHPVCQCDNEISAFRAVLPNQLLDVSNDLRNLIGDRRMWGQWRALAVDVVLKYLVAG